MRLVWRGCLWFSERVADDPLRTYAWGFKSMDTKVASHLPPCGFVCARQSSIEISRGADQSEMGKRLWEIPKMPAVGAQLF